ncbi:hypothetical protein BDQ17DRAFT_1235527 [Cyathus striatus]|nr:hypothetical protein BDQ17DRAFT_1235527 [Cyathus striatus]
MHLYLSSSSPLNSAYSTSDNRLTYHVTSPFQLVSLTSTIERIVPNYQPIAEIDFHKIRSTIIRYQGREISAGDFFTKGILGSLGSHRAFTGPDGKSYVWKFRNNEPELFVNDGSKTPVAHFHRRHRGFFSKSRPASLEIFPVGQHMMDLIIVTFVYIAKLREDRKKRARAAASSGGAS